MRTSLSHCPKGAHCFLLISYLIAQRGAGRATTGLPHVAHACHIGHPTGHAPLEVNQRDTRRFSSSQPPCETLCQSNIVRAQPARSTLIISSSPESHLIVLRGFPFTFCLDYLKMRRVREVNASNFLSL